MATADKPVARKQRSKPAAVPVREVVTLRLLPDMKTRTDTAANKLRVLDKTVSLQKFCEDAVIHAVELVESGKHPVQKAGG